MTKKELIARRDELRAKKEASKGELKARRDELRAKKEAAKPRGLGQTVAEHFTHGSVAGFSDELAGAIEAGLSKIYGEKSPYAIEQKLREEGVKGDLLPNAPFRTGQQEHQEVLDEGTRDHSIAAPVANIAGAVGLGSLVNKAGLGTLGQVAEGAVSGIGYGNADTLGGATEDAGVGAVLGGLVPGGVAIKNAVKGSKHVATPIAKNIYKSVVQAVNPKSKQKFLTSVDNLEGKYGVFTQGGKVAPNPENVVENLTSLKTGLYGELGKITQEASQATNPAALFTNFSPLNTKIDDMISKIEKSTTNTGLVKQLRASQEKLNEILVNGDYESLINFKTNELRGKYINFNSANQVEVPDIVKKEMLDLVKEFDNTNVSFLNKLDDTGKWGDTVKEVNKDLSDYYEIADTVQKNADRDLSLVETVKPSVGQMVGSGFLTGMFGPGAGGTFLGTTMVHKNPVTQGVIAQMRGKVQRTTQGALGLLEGPIGADIEAALPPEVSQGILSKLKNGIKLPPVQQQLFFKSVYGLVPELFQQTEYDSLVDGKLTDPVDIEEEKRKIDSDTTASNVEKYKQLKALNKDGTLTRPVQYGKEPSKLQNPNSDISGFLKNE